MSISIYMEYILCILVCICGSNKADGRLSSSLSPKLPNQNFVQFAKWDCQFVVIITTLLRRLVQPERSWRK